MTREHDTIEEMENDYCFFSKLLKGTLKQGPLLLIFFTEIMQNTEFSE